MKPLCSKIIKTMRFLGISLAGLLLLSVFIFSSKIGEPYLKNIVRKQLQKTLDLPVSIQSLETNLFSRVQVRNLRLFYPGQDTIFMQLPYGRLDYGLLPLLKKKVHLNHIQLDSLQIHLRRDSSGRFQPVLLARLFARDTISPTAAYKIQIRQFSLWQAGCFYADHYIPINARLHNLDFHLQESGPSHYQAELSIESGYYQYTDTPLPFDSLAAKMHYTPESLAVDQLVVGYSGYRITGQATLQLSDPSDHKLSGNLNLTGDLNSLATRYKERIPSPLYPVSGGTQVSTILGGSLSAPHLELTLSSPHLHFGQLTLSGTEILARISVDTVQVPRFYTHIAGGIIQGSLGFKPDSLLSQQTMLELKNLNLSPIWEIVYQDAEPYTGKLSGQLQARGPLNDCLRLKSELKLSLQALTYSTQAIDPISLAIRTENGNLSGTLQQADSYIRGNLNFTTDRISGRYQMNITSLAPLTGLLNRHRLEGKLTANGTISGSWLHPLISTAINGKNIYYQNFPMDQLMLELDYSPGMLQLKRLNINGQLAKIEPGRRPFNLTGLRGGLTYAINLSGRYPRLAGEISCQLIRPGYKQYQFNRADLQMDITKGQVSLTDCLLEHNDWTLTGRGVAQIKNRQGKLTCKFYQTKEIKARPRPAYGILTVDFDLSRRDQPKATFTAEQLRLGNILTPFLESLPIDGTLSGTLSTSGPYQRPKLTLTADITSPRYKSFFLEHMGITAQYSGPHLVIDSVTARLDQARARLSGTLTFSPNHTQPLLSGKIEEVKLQANGQQWQLSVLRPLLTGHLDLSGAAGFALTLQGSGSTPQVDGRFTLRDMAFRLPAAPYFRGINLHGVIRNNMLSFEQFSGMVDAKSFYIQGRLGLVLPDQLITDLEMQLAAGEILKVKGKLTREEIQAQLETKQLDLALLPTVFNGIHQAGGHLNSKINFSGKWNRPMVAGRLQLNDGLLQIAPHTPAIRSIALDTRIRDNQIEVQHLSGEIRNTPFKMQGQMDVSQKHALVTSLNLVMAGQEALSLQAHSRGAFLTAAVNVNKFELAYLEALAPTVHQIRGKISTQMTVHGKRQHPQIQGDLHLEQGHFKLSPTHPAIENIRMHSQLKDTLIEVTALTGLIGKTPFNFRGDLSHSQWQNFQTDLEATLYDQEVIQIQGGYTDQQLQLNIALDKADLALTRAIIPDIHRLAGQLSANLTLTGTPRKPRLQGQLQLDSTLFQWSPDLPIIDNISTEIFLQDTLLEIRHFQALTEETPWAFTAQVSRDQWKYFQTELQVFIAEEPILSGEGYFTPEKLNADLKITALNISAIHPWFRQIAQLGGYFDSRILLEGPWQSPQYEAAFELKEGLIQWNPALDPIDNIQIAGQLSDTLLTIAALQADITGHSYQMKGKIWHRTGQAFYPVLEIKTNDQIVLECQGVIQKNYTDLDIRLNQFNLKTLNSVTPYPRQIEGQINGQLVIRGTPRFPSFEGGLDFQQAAYQINARTRLQAITAALSMDKRTIQVNNLEGLINDTPFHLQANLTSPDWHRFQTDWQLQLAHNNTFSGTGLISSEFIDLHTQLNNLDLLHLQPLLPDLQALGGRLQAELHIQGKTKQPSLKGTLELQEGVIQLASNPYPLSELNLHWLLQDSIFTLQSFHVLVRNKPVRLNGKVHTVDWRAFQTNFDMDLDGIKTLTGRGKITPPRLQLDLAINNFDLALLQPLTTQVQALNGWLNANLSIRDHYRAPRINGSLYFRDIKFRPAGMRENFNKGIVKARFDNQTLTLDSLKIYQNQGFLTGSGILSYQDSGIVDLQAALQARGLKFAHFRRYTLRLERLNAKMKKQDDYYHLDGDIRLGESRYRKNFSPQALLSLVNQAAKSPGQPPAILRNTRLNVRLRESKDLWIDNNLARLRLHPELTLTGSPTAPNISGRLNIKEGYVLYLDRKFKVQRGVIDFTDPHRINPIMDFQATTELHSYQTLSKKEYKITLTLQGHLDQLMIELHSEPPRDRTDIIALLTVGATREELLSEPTGFNGEGLSAVLQARLKEYSSQKISAFASQKVGSLFGLESMSIEGNLFNFGKSWGPELVASKQLSERMTVTYTSTVGHLNEQRVRLNYQLSDKLSVVGQTDQQGRAGLDFQYQLKFK